MNSICKGNTLEMMVRRGCPVPMEMEEKHMNKKELPRMEQSQWKQGF